MMENQFKPTQSAPPPLPQTQQIEDGRVGLIKSIWGWATAMLGICIPLTGAMQHSPVAPLLPICVIAGATIGTLALWFGKNHSTRQLPSQSEAALREQLRQIEERLANVETISSFERGLHEREALAEMGAMPSPTQEHDSLAARPSPPVAY